MSEIQNLDAFRAGLAERYFRPGPLTIQDLASDVVESDADLTPPPGSITVFFARDSAVLRQLENGLANNDANALLELRRLADGRRSAHVHGDADALRVIQAADPIFDIRYAGRTVAANRALPEGELLGSVTLSWTGGRLDDDRFVVAEYGLTELPDQQLVYRAYRRAPALTELERSMVERIPDDMSEINLALLPASDTTTMEQVCRIVEQAARDAAAHRTAGPEILDNLQNLISAGEISPEASVRELVRARLALMARTSRRSGS